MQIAPITSNDFALFWPTFKTIVQAQETYALDPEIDFDDAYSLWCERPQSTYVAKESSAVLGSYYLKPNAAGPGDHVCNCGYMVAPQARGKGVARALCLNSQDRALEAGYLRCSSMHSFEPFQLSAAQLLRPSSTTLATSSAGTFSVSASSSGS